MRFRIQVSILLLSVVTGCIAVAPTFKLPLIRSIVQQAGHLGQPVVNYYAPVNIGTPKKTFKIQFDTDFNELFVPHYEFWGSKLHHSEGYQCKKSSSCYKTNEKIKIFYQQCRLEGKPYEDEMSFDTAQPYLRRGIRQKFLAISEASNSRFKNLEVDGFFGLSPALQSTSGSRVKSLLHNLQQSQLIEKMQFSFWFNPVHDSNQGAEITFGGFDTSRFKDQFYYHKLDDSQIDRWALDLQLVKLGERTVSSGCGPYSKCQVILSTGVSEIYGPSADVYGIYDLLNTRPKDKQSLPLVDCRRIHDLPILTFFIGGHGYSLIPTNYVRKVKVGRKETCYVTILPSTEHAQYQWILGTNFLGAYYTVFDLTGRQVGFATAR